jgi:hypothetical protein
VNLAVTGLDSALEPRGGFPPFGMLVFRHGRNFTLNRALGARRTFLVACLRGRFSSEGLVAPASRLAVAWVC